MDVNLDQWFQGLYSIGSLLFLYLILFLIANVIYGVKSGFNVKDQVVSCRNNAVAMAFSGYLIAISVIFIGCVIGPSKGIFEDIVDVVIYSSLGLVLLFAAHIINDKVILYKFCNQKELVTDKNIATGLVQASSYIASGLIIAGAIQGEGGGVLSALAFFMCGQISLIIISKIYNFITTFDLHHEIENDNTAAGIGFSGTLVALGIILSQAAAGDFISWSYNMGHFLLMTTVACILLPLFRVIIDKLVLPQVDLNDEISKSRNTGASILEFAITVGFSTVLSFLI